MRAYVMQPPYLGWLGFWEGIIRSDVYVLYDHVQYEHKSWQSRNRIRNAQGEVWLTVPCETAGKQFQRINEVLIDSRQWWSPKHWRTLEQCYAHAEHKDDLALFRPIYAKPPRRLVDLNQAIIQTVMDALQIDTPIVRSSELGTLPSGREESIVAIVRAVGCDTLYDAAGAKDLLDPKPFEDAGISLEFQHYTPVEYRQCHSGWIPYLSIMDALLNLGPATKEAIVAGTLARAA